jgi:putative serine protease PepD
VERSEWGGDDESFPIRPPLPPEDRVWRHPSELHAVSAFSGGPAGPHRGRRRAALAIAAGMAGVLLVLGIADAALRTNEASSPAVATTVFLRAVTTLKAAPSTSAAPRTSVAPTTTLAAAPATTVPPTSSPTSSPTTLAAPASSAPLSSPLPSVMATTDMPGLLRLIASTPAGDRAAAAIAIDDQGTLVTSMSAVRDASTLTVVLADGQAALARVVGVDGNVGTAVLDIDAPTTPALTGKAANLEPGTWVATPWPGRNTAVITSLGVDARAPSGEKMRHLVAVDAPAAVGMSEGEPLLDDSDHVVALCTRDANNRLLAVPIELAIATARMLLDDGRISIPWLGVGGQDRQDENGGPTTGAVVGAVQDDSPAEAAGISSGDVITAVGDQPVNSMAALVLMIRDHRPGDALTLTVERDGASTSVTVTLAEQPATQS